TTFAPPGRPVGRSATNPTLSPRHWAGRWTQRPPALAPRACRGEQPSDAGPIGDLTSEDHRHRVVQVEPPELHIRLFVPPRVPRVIGHRGEPAGQEYA